MSKEEFIHILIPTISKGRRWLKEIERANEENPETILGYVRHPYDFKLLIPENAKSPKLINQDKNFRVLRTDDTISPSVNNLKFDAVIPRISGVRTFEYGCNLVRHLTLMGAYSTAPAWALETCSNKWKTSQLLATHGLPVPDQLLLNSINNFEETMALIKGVPAIGKLSRGSQGSGVFILNDLLAAKTALQSMKKLNAEITLNRFVKTSEEEDTVEDIRVWVVNASGKEPKFFAMKRVTNNDFRANLSLNGRGEKIELTSDEEEICLSAAKIFNMDVVAVDLIRDITNQNAPLILELNGNPGLKIERFTNCNIVGAVVDMVIEKVRERRKSNQEQKYIFNENETVLKNNYSTASKVFDTFEKNYTELIKSNIDYLYKNIEHPENFTEMRKNLDLLNIYFLKIMNIQKHKYEVN